MEFEQMSDDLPWGAGIVPEWWLEVTPHHVLALDEVDQERREEAARLAAMRAEWTKSPAGSIESMAAEQSGEWMMDTSSGPYSSLPGFQGSDGIEDASFIGPGHIKWSITSDGFFYTDDGENEEEAGPYTSAQMVESGHLPPGMEDYFVPGWDRLNQGRSATPVDTKVYARTEASGWQRPDWLQKKLRTSDEGIALRHGVDGRAVSPSPRRRIGATPSPVDTSFLPSPNRVPRRPRSVSPSNYKYSRGTTTTKKDANAKPEWKQRQEEFAAAKKGIPARAASADYSKGAPFAGGGGAFSSQVPEWKRKHDEFAKKHGEPTVLEAQGAGGGVNNVAIAASSSVASPAWKKQASNNQKDGKEEEKKPSSLSPFMKKTDSPSSDKKSDASSTVPAWKKKQADAAVASDKAVPAWKKKQVGAAPEPAVSSTPAWKKPQPTTESVSSEPSWKKKQEAAASASAASSNSNAPPVSKKLNLAPKAAVPASLQSVVSTVPPAAPSPVPDRSRPSTPAENDRSQTLVMKLMHMGDDAGRAKELRNTIAPVAENNHTVVVPPHQLLEAIAHHAQACKGNKEQMDSLRQVAIIARLVIMKLYGAGTPELKQFEEGLRPAFA